MLSRRPDPGGRALAGPCGDSTRSAAGWGVPGAPGKRNLSPKPGGEGSVGGATPTSPSRPDARNDPPGHRPALPRSRAPRGPGAPSTCVPRGREQALLWGRAGGGPELQGPPRKSRALAAGSRVLGGRTSSPGPPLRFLGTRGGRAGMAGVAGPAGFSHSSPSRSTPCTCRVRAGGHWQLMGVERQWGKLKTPHKTRLFFFSRKVGHGRGRGASGSPTVWIFSFSFFK